jgi:hypothetical protein
MWDNGAMHDSTNPPMSSDTKRSLIVSWGIALIALFIAWKFSTAPVMWTVLVLGAVLVLHGHWPRVFTKRRIFSAGTALLLIGVVGGFGWYLRGRIESNGRHDSEQRIAVTEDDPPPCGAAMKPGKSAGTGLASSAQGTTESIPASDAATVQVTRGSSASGATIREFTTHGTKAIYEVSMAMPGWMPEELEFRFAENKAIVVARNKPFPQSLKASGSPLQVERFTDVGYELNDHNCPGIPYSVVWLRGSELHNTSTTFPKQSKKAAGDGKTSTPGGSDQVSGIGNGLAGRISAGPCSVVQNGGVGNTAKGCDAPPFRTLIDTQKAGITAFVDTLPPSVLITIGSVLGSADGNSYAVEFMPLFKGHLLDDQQTPSIKTGFPKEFAGVFVATTTDNDSASHYRDELVNTLVRLGIPAHKANGSKVKSGNLEFLIGYRLEEVTPR